MIIRHLSIDCAYINKVLEPITQREHGVTEFEIELKNHGADIDLSECTLAIYYGLKPDEHKVGVECRVDKDKGLIYLPLYLQMTTAEGVLKGIVELQFPEGNVRFSGINFKVSFAPDDTKIESTDDFNILENFISKPTTDGVVGQVLSIDNDGNTIWRTLKEFDGDYAHLDNKPSINGVELNGDKSLEDLNIKQTYTADDIPFADGETFQQKFNNGELKGQNGLSAYEIAKNGGFIGTEEDWLRSLKGEQGEKGEKGIQGEQGEKGQNGTDGKTPVKGVDYFTAEDKTEFTAEVTESLKPELAKKQDKLTAGENIRIAEDGTINAVAGEVIDVDAELKEYMTTTKQNIKTAIEYKGGTIEPSDSFNAYADRIKAIPNGVTPTSTLPPQTVLVADALYETPSIQLKWQDTEASGYRIVKKENIAPTNVLDGETVFNGTGITYTDTTVEVGRTYYYRIFPYNAEKQYQTEETKSIVKVDYKDRTGQVLLGSLKTGDTIVFGAYNGVKIKWTIFDTLDKEKGFITVGSLTSPAGRMVFDQPENASGNPNPISQRKSQGNNRYYLSNIRQWLNSNKPKNEWWTASHDYDTAPSYKSRNGFMYEITDYEKSIIVPKSVKCILDTNDGGGSETMTDYFFLCSSYAMGTEVVYPLEDAHIYEWVEGVGADNRKFEDNYWCRTISGTSSASQLRCFGSTGGLYNYYGGASNGNNSVRPFSQLSTSTYMQWSDSDSAYVLADDSQLT